VRNVCGVPSLAPASFVPASEAMELKNAAGLRACFDHFFVRVASPGAVLGALSNGDEEDGALAFSVRGEETDYVVIVEGQTGGAQQLGVGREIELTAEDAGFKLHRAISSIAKALQYGSQIRKEKDVHGGVAWQFLLQSEVTCLCAEISLPETLKQSTVAVIDVSSGSKTLHRMDDQVKIIELRSHGIEEVRRYAAGSSIQQS
jgi:hypothetical protein